MHSKRNQKPRKGETTSLSSAGHAGFSNCPEVICPSLLFPDLLTAVTLSNVYVTALLHTVRKLTV